MGSNFLKKITKLFSDLAVHLSRRLALRHRQETNAREPGRPQVRCYIEILIATPGNTADPDRTPRRWPVGHLQVESEKMQPGGPMDPADPGTHSFGRACANKGVTLKGVGGRETEAYWVALTGKERQRRERGLFAQARPKLFRTTKSTRRATGKRSARGI